MSALADALRVYAVDECGSDGYPPEWHAIDGGPGIKHLVRERAGHRCARCHHPYRPRGGEWTPCDGNCVHGGPVRLLTGAGFEDRDLGDYPVNRLSLAHRERVLARWRVLTVHHLDGEKANCRWWNLAPLCQRCHLTIQGKVVMERAFIFEHSDWFKPYAAAWYALKYLAEDLSLDEVRARQEELLALERLA